MKRRAPTHKQLPKRGRPSAPLPPAQAKSTKKMMMKRRMSVTESMEERMERLQGGRFRWINEMLYTSTGEQAAQAFREDPELFAAYHAGYSLQVAQWPQDPLDAIIAAVRAEAQAVSAPAAASTSSSPSHAPRATTKLRVADLGCGVARMAAELEPELFDVHSFDLVAANERVTACNIAHVPLPPASVDVAVFCLSLMGTDHATFIAEALRILVPGGLLLVAEPKSRIDDVATFVRGMRLMGFARQMVDETNTMFVLFSFRKVASQAPPDLARASPKLALKPCPYKRR